MKIYQINNLENHYAGVTNKEMYVWGNKMKPFKLNIPFSKLIFTDCFNSHKHFYIFGIAENVVFYWKNHITDSLDNFININCYNINIQNKYIYFYTPNGFFRSDSNNPSELEKLDVDELYPLPGGFIYSKNNIMNSTCILPESILTEIKNNKIKEVITKHDLCYIMFEDLFYNIYVDKNMLQSNIFNKHEHSYKNFISVNKNNNYTSYIVLKNNNFLKIIRNIYGYYLNFYEKDYNENYLRQLNFITIDNNYDIHKILQKLSTSYIFDNCKDKIFIDFNELKYNIDMKNIENFYIINKNIIIIANNNIYVYGVNENYELGLDHNNMVDEEIIHPEFRLNYSLIKSANSRI